MTQLDSDESPDRGDDLERVVVETRKRLRVTGVLTGVVLLVVATLGWLLRSATADLGTLRGDVEANLRKIEGLINEINRKWPFSRDTEIKVP